MEIQEMMDRDRTTWDNFVQAAGGGLPYHLSGWRDVLSRTYGYDTFFLMATEGEHVVGVLPLFIVRSFLVGSQAMTMLGGLCAERGDVAQALIAQGKEIARQARVKRLVFQDSRQAWPGDLHTTSEHVHWTVDLRAGPDALWLGLHKNVRRQVRLARKNGLVVKIDRKGDMLDDFYHVLSHFSHEAGTPVFEQRFLETVVEVFPGRFSIAVTYLENQPVGGYFQMIMGDTVHGAWGATLHKYLPLRATYLVYWELIRDSAVNGFNFIDLGRSPADPTTSPFKKQWSTYSAPIYQQVATIGERGAAKSITQNLQSSAVMRCFMQIWPKLPYPIAQLLGPKLRTHVPFA